MKKYKRGLVMGRFEPFHNGHKYLVETALENSEIVVLLVCTIKSEKIPGYLRYDWVRRIFSEEEKKGNLIIKHITDEAPQEPRNKFDTDFWNIWINIFNRESKDFDAIFTSEPYGDEIVHWMKKILDRDIEHYCVDLDRKYMPICATDIRTNPLKFWSYIPKIERPYFIKKICITGPESVGKTIMTKMLAKEYNCPFVMEYGREYCNNLKNPSNLNTLDFSNVASNQLWQEEEASYKSENGLLICDTDLIVTEIFSYLYTDSCPDWIQKINRIQKYDLYLLLSDEVEYVQDGTRIFENIRNDHFHIIRRELHKRNLNYEIINGSNYDNRLEQAKKYINKII